MYINLLNDHFWNHIDYDWQYWYWFKITASRPSHLVMWKICNEEMQLWSQNGGTTVLCQSCYLTFLPNNPTFDKFLTRHEQGFSDVSIQMTNSIDIRDPYNWHWHTVIKNDLEITDLRLQSVVCLYLQRSLLDSLSQWILYFLLK